MDKNTFLVGTLSNGLYLFRRETGSINKIEASDKLSVIDIFKNKAGEFFISTWGDGVYVFDARSNTFSKLAIKLPNQFIRQIERDISGRYWLLSGDGIVYFNNLESSFKKIELFKNSGIETYRGLFTTSNGNVWIATLGYGAFQYAPKTSQFQLYSTASDKKNYSFFTSINSLSEMSSDLIAVCNEDKTISLYSPKTKSSKKITVTKNSLKPENGVIKIYRISKEELLASTEIDLFRLDVKEDSTEIVETKQYDFLSNYSAMQNSTDSSLLLVTDKNTDTLQQLPINDFGNLYVKTSSEILASDIQTTYISIDSNNFILFRPYQPILKVRIGDKMKVVAASSYKLLGRHISPTLDASGNLWISLMNSGLYMIKNANLMSGELKLIYPKIGIVSIEVDGDDNLWLAGYDGLTVFNPNTKKANIFDENDGLQAEEFNQAGLLASDGSIYFGGLKGFNRFFPDQIKPNTERLSVKLTNLFINGKRTRPGLKIESMLSKSITSTSDINLNHSQNNFGIELSAMEVPQAQKKIKYAYKLDGYEDD